MIKFVHTLDKITITLFLFLLFIALLFVYIFQIEKNMRLYAKNKEYLTQLQFIDKDFNHFSRSFNSFKNYDIIDAKEKEFEDIFASLQSNLKLSNEENGALKNLLKQISYSFLSKVDDLEYYKAKNSALLNSSHFLFDLQTTIQNDKQLSLQAKATINELLFYLLKYVTSDYIDKSTIQKQLQHLQQITKKENSPHLHTFYKQAKQMLQTVHALKEVSHSIQNNPLQKRLQELQRLLIHNYNEAIYKQSLIASFFFISTLILLIFLIILHIKSVKTQQELSAFKVAIEHSDNTVVITDTQRCITYVNEAFEKTSGYKAKEVLGKNPNILKSGLQSQDFYKELNEKLSRNQKWEGEFINKRKDGSLFYEKASIVPLSFNNKPFAYLALKLDITEYIEQNKKLAQAASVFENTEEAIIIADNQGKVLSVNSAFTKIYGYSLEEVKGHSLHLLHSNKHDENFYKHMWQELQNKGIWRNKIINKAKNGTIVPVWTTIKRIVDEKGSVVNYTAIQTDLRELESSQAEANYLAYHDPLTGLYNRVNFEEYLNHTLPLAKRNNSLLALLFIDLDRFKVINDTLGHDIGDRVLIEVAQRLKKVLRESDFIARWGGDEFVVVLENLSSVSDVARVATHIIEALQQPIQVNKNKLLTTASIGIALYPEDASDAQTLIKYADSAMYLAKDKGKNNYRFYTAELSKEVQKRLAIDMALHNALTNNEMYMMFQPQYSLKTKEIIAAEALIRWENEQLGFVPPDQFIPIAEDSGAIIKIGYFVFEESCRALCNFRSAGIDLKFIAVNVSTIQFRESQLLEKFLQIIQKYNLQASDIEIEITERFMMEQTLQNMQLLQKFQDKGFKISIDDFGTGYSSMSYLKDLPVDTIKIDKSFVDDIGENNSNNVVIEAIIALAKTLGYTIVAEGIETTAQEEFLHKMQCDMGQGYLFSKPKKVEDLKKEFC
jgi:diguanylate cyclase (GGDEF)-like protein/PAS domain S-box-containing protein